MVLCSYVTYFVFQFFVATYQRFDGIILPEHLIQPPKAQYMYRGTWPFFAKDNPDTCHGVKLSSFDYSTRDLKLANHKELRKNGLLMHLNGMYDVLVGTESMDDPIHCAEVVCATYLSLHKYYLSYQKVYGLNCHEWTFYETTKVKHLHLLVCKSH